MLVRYVAPKSIYRNQVSCRGLHPTLCRELKIKLSKTDKTWLTANRSCSKEISSIRTKKKNHNLRLPALLKSLRFLNEDCGDLRLAPCLRILVCRLDSSLQSVKALNFFTPQFKGKRNFSRPAMLLKKKFLWLIGRWLGNDSHVSVNCEWRLRIWKYTTTVKIFHTSTYLSYFLCNM